MIKQAFLATTAAALTGIGLPVLAQDASDAGIAEYRAALQDGNPAELWEM